MSIFDRLRLSRRGFVKSAAAFSAASALTGCGSGGEDVIMASDGLSGGVTPEDLSQEQIYWATGVHHCGAGIRCATKIHVANGRVARITSDDSDYDFRGNYRDKEMWTDSRSLACTKCKSYKYRLYHPGRLKYALKQTKQRGDMTGFVRVTSAQAMNEVARKYRAIFSKYGAGAIYETHAPGANDGGTFNRCHPARSALTNYIGGSRSYYNDYSFHQFYSAQYITGHPKVTYPWSEGIGSAMQHIAGVAKNLVCWGSNTLSSNNPVSWPYIRSVELMKKRCAEEGTGGKVYHISPEFVDTGVTLATDWVQLRNYTDAAMIMAMFHEMIVNTFNEDGSLKPKSERWLDVDYLDTFVYGFFDSPEYWLMTSTTDADAGSISLTEKTGAGWRKVAAVPAGKSLSAYVMGSDKRLQKAAYSDGKNYSAQTFAGAMAHRNVSGCSLTINGKAACDCTQAEINASKYYYKKDLMKPKTPEWAEAICGTPAATIREMAKMYCDPAQHPIVSEWCGGVQKSDNGVVSLWAIIALMCVTKTFGLNGEGLYGSWGTVIDNSGEVIPETLDPSAAFPADQPKMAKDYGYVPDISVKEWFNSIKVAFYDKMKENGYTGKHIPNWNQSDRFVNDDAGAKTGVVWKRDANGDMIEYTDPETGLKYYDYMRDPSNPDKPLFSGTRMIINPSGSMQMNQHFNTNDTAEMYRSLPLASKNPDDPDTYCFVTFDNFLTPASRFADYVFPATVSLEAGDWTAVGDLEQYRPPVVKPMGEAKDGWRYAYEAYLEQTKLGDFSATFGDFQYNRTVDPDAHLKYVGTATTSREYQPAETLSFKVVDEARNNPSSRFYGMTREQVFANQFQPRANQAPQPSTDLGRTQLRTNLDNYLALSDAERMSKPFVYSGSRTNATAYSANMGNEDYDMAEDISDRPLAAGRFQVYNMTVVWDYMHRFSKYHGWLPKERRGQKNGDREGDWHVLPIPIYWNFQDCFNENYGVFDGKSTEIKDGLTLGTTHDRFRVHSSLAENPLLREMNHRTQGGGWASSNDWKAFAMQPTVHAPGGTAAIPAMLSTAIETKNRETATWHEVWVNSDDAKDRGIADGDLVLLKNPIGAVRVIARVTDRCVRGHLNLHQGSWYDPNPVDGVDDGGCANTLMSSVASRYDHGNSQQMALVQMSKVTDFFNKAAGDI